MKENYARLLLQLQQHPQGIGGAALADKLNVSTRTIRNYIKELNENYLAEGKILADSAKGYLLQGSINHLTETDQLIFEQRAFFIIKQLLATTEMVTYDQIAARLRYSVQTIRNDLYKIQELIDSEQRNIKVESIIFQGLQLTGDELDCRLLLDSLCSPQQLSSNQLLDDLAFYFGDWRSDARIRELAAAVYQAFEARRIRCTVPLLRSVMVYLVIATYRSAHGHVIESPLRSSTQVNVDMLALARDLYRAAAGEQAVPEAELQSFYWFLISQQFADSEHTAYFKLNPQIRGWVDASLTTIDTTYRQHFAGDEQLVRDLTLHISRDILPLEANFYIENSYLHHIKTDYVIAYQYAVSFAHALAADSTIELPDNEIGYVALHFAAYIERHRSRDISIAVVYGAHSVTCRLLANRIEEYFPNIRVTQLVNAANLEDLMPSDFIVASERVVLELTTPVVTVHDMLTTEDVQAIDRQVNQMILTNVLQHGALIHSDARSPKAVIQELLVALDRTEMLDDVLDRERLSSTETGSFAAIPHPLVMRAGCPFQLGIAVLSRPLSWGGQDVRLVLLPLPDPNNNSEYERVFGILQKVIANDANVAKLAVLQQPSNLLKLI